MTEQPPPMRSEQTAAGSLHVLTLTPFYPSAEDDGRGCFVSEPLALLASHSVENTVLAVQSFYNGPVTTSQNAPPVRWIRYMPLPSGFGLPSAGVFLYANILRSVRDLVRRKPVHLIHAHSALPCGHAAALLSKELGIPFVVTVHGLDAFSTNQVKGLPGRLSKRISQPANTTAGSRRAFRLSRMDTCISVTRSPFA